MSYQRTQAATLRKNEQDAARDRERRAMTLAELLVLHREHQERQETTPAWVFVRIAPMLARLTRTLNGTARRSRYDPNHDEALLLASEAVLALASAGDMTP